MSNLPSPSSPSLEGEDLKDLKSVFFSGVGGHGMSVLARILAAEGVETAGSDIARTPITKELEDAGIKVFPQDGSHMGGARVLVWSSAIREDNPDVRKALESGMLLAHRSDVLSLLMRGKKSIAVSGTHGKTTTSCIASFILLEAGKDPGWALGSSFKTLEGEEPGWRKGREAFVAEADESDGSFLKYATSVAVVTNSDGDHFDHYGSIEAYREAFRGFISHSGRCVMCMDDAGNRELFKSLDTESKRKVLGYGESAFEDLASELSGLEEENYARLEGIRLFPASSPTASSFSLSFRGKQTPVEMRLPGRHNDLNAAAAILACFELGVGLETGAEAASKFLGSARRFELLGEEKGIKLFTDYGHHPAEIAAFLSALKSSYPSSPIGVMFEPFNSSRVAQFAARFAKSLSLADKVILVPIFRARATAEDALGVKSEDIKEEARKIGGDGKFECAGSLEEGAKILASWAEEGSVLATIGAGTIARINSGILNLLREKR